MSIEVSACAYLFQYKGVSDLSSWKPAFLGDSLSAALIAEENDERISSKPGHPGHPLPFRYHLLNDWESLFWVSMYMVIYRVVEPTENRPRQPAEKFRAQCILAAELFDDPVRRPVMFSAAPSEAGDRLKWILQGCLHQDLVPVGHALAEIRVGMIKAYLKVEANPSKHPDGTESLRIMVGPIAEYYHYICSYLDAEDKSDITIARIPRSQKSKTRGHEQRASSILSRSIVANIM
ncbi:uncharacterized protein PHACADRAFT_180643 [Phanerochaete carnosa HHB-10118-sp]|uniref:Fungal-type protein kinase domain-containing protein n=1 Tax=Phanerochaete carnosa (strain HHB-10118-sp) TaxID=650164 RepID=K5WC54_PHACS|nr:uncharacterized protein PHACADRAFT_180643 [Phanerochaete carnosa HHB-10118-sp]EKM61533.1 hypothetical protein PHACADRAFT_180643 [Phanerochaete carnosa HHB-10118-sp]